MNWITVDWKHRHFLVVPKRGDASDWSDSDDMAVRQYQSLRAVQVDDEARRQCMAAAVAVVGACDVNFQGDDRRRHFVKAGLPIVVVVGRYSHVVRSGNVDLLLRRLAKMCAAVCSKAFTVSVICSLVLVWCVRVDVQKWAKSAEKSGNEKPFPD